MLLNHEISRYILNGLLATAVHYGFLNINVALLHFQSTGLANGIASIAGIASSFIGNRYFVFHEGRAAPWKNQAIRFSALYSAIALLHTGFMWLWSDHLKLSLHLGFLIATALQFTLSFLGNRLYIFKNET
jgi:putative flippase GtrA